MVRDKNTYLHPSAARSLTPVLQSADYSTGVALNRINLSPHRGISQEKLPLYLSFFEFVHNAKKRGKALLSALLETLLA